MAAEISDKNSSLNNAQDVYRRRREDLEDQNQQNLSRVREDGQRQLNRANKETAAAVSHVRQDAAERIEQARRDADQKLTYARKDLEQRYHTTKKLGEQSLESENQSLNVRRGRLDSESARIHQRASDLRRAESEANAKLEGEGQSHRHELLKATQKEVSDVYARAQQKMSTIREKANTDADHEIQEHHHQLEQLHDQHQKIYNSQAHSSETQLRTQSEQNALRIENERQEFLGRERSLKNHGQEGLRVEKETAASKLDKLSKDNDQALMHERTRGAKAAEGTRLYYREQIGRLHESGEKRIVDERAKYTTEASELKAEESLELQQHKTQHQADLESIDLTFKERGQQNATFYKGALAGQAREFAKAEALNQHTFEENVREQKARLAKSLVQEKAETLKTVGQYHDRKDDPFYHITQIEGRVEETATHYVLKAQVPEHEKNNVQVRIKGDKMVIEGHRRFKDKLSEQGSEISSENYQTFHEAIPLAHPVLSKYMRRDYQAGVLTVTVPKA